jgi:hypothetical protein
MGGTQPTNPPATETPTPTTGLNKPWTQSQATDYTAATPTPSDNLTVANPTGSYLLSKAKDGMKFFASRFGEAAVSAAATKMIDRAIPTMGADNTAFLSPRDAQHIPNSWVAGLKGRLWATNNSTAHTFVRLKDTDYPADSLFALNKIDPVMDTFEYTSPFTGNVYSSNYGMIPDHEGGYAWYKGGGLIPLYAWGVREFEVELHDYKSGVSNGVYKAKSATHMFFKEVFDDWVASRGFDRYSEIVDGLPGAGWPGLLVTETPYGNDSLEEKGVQGMKCWSLANPYIAHKEFTSEPNVKQQVMRYAKYYVSGNTTKEIEYPAEARPTRDEFPEAAVASDTEIPVDVQQRDFVDGAGSVEQRPTTADFDALLESQPNGAGDPMETDIPVLPSQPAGGDDPDLFYRIFQGVNMNAGYASYRKDGVDVKQDGQGYYAYSADEAMTEMLKTDNCQGFALDKSNNVALMYFANNWNSGQLGVTNFPNYDNNYEYYSRWVTPSSSFMRVGVVFYDAIGGIGGKMGFMSPGGWEMNDRADTEEFRAFGAAVSSESDTDRFYTHLASQMGEVRRAKGWEDVSCCAFEVDVRDGTGYFTRYL